jgi:hypothetical protein
VLLDANRRRATRLRLVVERGRQLPQALRREGVVYVLSLHGSLAGSVGGAAPH